MLYDASGTQKRYMKDGAEKHGIKFSLNLGKEQKLVR